MIKHLAWLALVHALLSATAWAQASPAGGDAAIARGVALRREGKNAEALIEFQRAYARDPTPRALAQIALAEQALGHFVAAESGLEHALVAGQDPWIARNAAALETALATTRTHLATLRIETDVAGATLFVGGKSVGTSPLTAALRVEAGSLEVEARAPGRQACQKRVTLGAGEEQTISLTLPAVEPPPAATVAPPVVASVANTPSAARPVEPPKTAASFYPGLSDSSSREPPRDASHAAAGFHTAAIVSFVAGGLFLGGAITAHVIREYNAEKLDDPAYCSADYDCSGHKHAAETAETLAIVGYSAAGVAVLTGVLLLVLAPDDAPVLSRSFVPAFGPHDATFSWRASF